MNSDGKNIGDITNLVEKIEIESFEFSKKIQKYPILRFYPENSKQILDIQIMKCDIFNLILDEIKQDFKISVIPKTRAFINLTLESTVLKEIMFFKISNFSESKNQKILKLSDFSNSEIKNLPPSFVKEVRRIFIFRYLMCLSSNNESSIYVKKIEKENPILKTKTFSYTPLVLSEISYEKESSYEFSEKILRADFTRIPKTVIEKWFKNYDSKESSEEFAYGLIKEMVSDIDIFELKDGIRKKIHKYLKEYKDKRALDSSKDFDKKIKSIESLLWWNNVVYERIRQYK